ncbi:MAG: hypothetical protein RL758_1624 [Pseudomonadota bacterium]|jgi:hypothetical protein
MSGDDRKHTERVPVNLTEREFLDVCREAGRMDMKPGEFLRFLVRRSLYGSVGMTQPCGKQNRGDE